MQVRATWRLVVTWLLACSAGCGDDGAPAAGGRDGGATEDGGAADDGGSPATPTRDDAGAADAGRRLDECALEVTEELSRDAGVVVKRFSYRSQGLLILGTSCRPAGGGPHPLLIYNHGGASGLSQGDLELCVNFARNAGFTVYMSEYRGEGGSEGNIEVCLGEVDDVLRLLACAKQLPGVDGERAAMLGLSHGGCITARAAQRGADLRAAVDVFGPSDFAAEHAFWNATLDGGASGMLATALRELITLLETVTGGTPAQQAEAYAARSTLTTAAELDAFAGDLLIVHGTDDALVPPGQSCELARAAAGFSAYHVAADGRVSDTAPAGCETPALAWSAGPLPSPSWPGSRHLAVYDGAGHDLNPAVPAQERMVEAIVTFIAAKLAR